MARRGVQASQFMKYAEEMVEPFNCVETLRKPFRGALLMSFIGVRFKKGKSVCRPLTFAYPTF